MNENMTLKIGKEYTDVEFNRTYAGETILDCTQFHACTFTESDLHRATLFQSFFGESTLNKCDLSSVSLVEGVFDGSEVADTNLTDADLSYTGIYRTTWRGCTADRVDLGSANVRETSLEDCQVRVLTAKGAAFTQVTLARVDLGRMELTDNGIQDLEARDVQLTGSTLDGVFADGVLLENCDLHWVRISKSWIDRLTLRACDTTGMTVRDTTFTGCDFTGWRLDKVDCKRVVFDSCTFDLDAFRTLVRLRDAGLVSLRGDTDTTAWRSLRKAGQRFMKSGARILDPCGRE